MRVKKEKRDSGHSIRGILKYSYTTIIASLTVPLAVLLLFVLAFVHQYGAVIENIARAAEAQTVAQQELPDEIWQIVSGRQKFGQGRQGAQIQQLRSLLQTMQRGASDKQRQYLNAAGRAADTIEHYIEVLGAQTAQGSAVSRNENLYHEIVSVTGLTADMLSRYTTEAIDEMARLNGRIRTVALAMAALVILLLGLVARAAVRSYQQVDRSIRAPILQMEKMAARIAQGDLNARAPVPEIEELYRLAVDLNRMAEQLNRLIGEQVEHEKNMKKAELRALQAQITPHFVYNTLETIVWLAEEERNREVVEMTMAFTDFLRISLSGGQDFISVAKEEQHVRSYLMIQSVRYGSVMRYEIDIDPALQSCRMLKLMLQPLVENAIYHGVKNKRGRGLIRITGRRENGWMRFAVEDNGIGMTEEALFALRGRLQRGEESGSYGLRNITERLRLYGGKGLFIDSEQMRGTRVEFLLPTAPENWEGD